MSTWPHLNEVVSGKMAYRRKFFASLLTDYEKLVKLREESKQLKVKGSVVKYEGVMSVHIQN
jgi:hypothetical protein